MTPAPGTTETAGLGFGVLCHVCRALVSYTTRTTYHGGRVAHRDMRCDSCDGDLLAQRRPDWKAPTTGAGGGIIGTSEAT